MSKAWIIGLVVCLAAWTSALHSRHQQKEQVYDEEAYLQALQDRQDKFRGDIEQIRLQISSMDALIKESTMGSDDKLASLNEGLADERDSLYNIETYLDRPFEIDPCQEV